MPRFELGDLAAFLRRWPGVVDVLTAADVPHNAFAIFPDLRDQPVLADGVVRFRGEAVLAIVGDASTLLSLHDDDLPLRFAALPEHETVEAALAAAAAGAPLHERYPDNVLCRGRVVSGDVDAAFADASRAAFRASSSFETRHVEHAYIEPEAGYAEVIEAKDGAPRRLRIFACTQTPYMDRDEIASIMRLAPAAGAHRALGDRRRLRRQARPLGAAAARRRRVEARPAGAPRLRAAGVDAVEHQAPPGAHEGTACVRCAGPAARPSISSGDFNTGAYSSWGPTVANRVPIHASGPYLVPNVRALTRAVLTQQQRRRRLSRFRRAAGVRCSASC